MGALKGGEEEWKITVPSEVIWGNWRRLSIDMDDMVLRTLGDHWQFSELQIIRVRGNISFSNFYIYE